MHILHSDHRPRAGSTLVSLRKIDETRPASYQRKLRPPTTRHRRTAERYVRRTRRLLSPCANTPCTSFSCLYRLTTHVTRCTQTRTRQKFQSFYRYPPAESLKAWNSPAIADKSLAHEPEYSSRPRRRRRYESENHSYQPIRHDSPPRMPEAVVPPPPAPTGPAYVPQHRSEDEPHRYHHHHSRSTRESSERRHEPRRRRRRSRSPPPPPSRRERHESDSRARDRDRPSSRRHRDASVQRSVTMPSGRTISNPVMIQSTSRFKEMFT